MSERFDIIDERGTFLCAQRFSNLDSALSYIGKDIMLHGIETNPRGMKTKELLGRTFVVTDIKKKIVSNPARKMNIFFFYGELIWYMKGSDDLEHIQHYNKRMKQFSDDGSTLRSAYGKRLFGLSLETYNFNQFDYVVKMLIDDPSSRKAIMHIRTIKDSMFKDSKDMPCTIALQYFIRDEKLMAFTSMRSNDIVYGATYDIPFFMYMQERIAWDLGVEVGEYYHQAMSLHVYETHYKMVEEMYDLCNSDGPRKEVWTDFSMRKLIHYSPDAPTIGNWSKQTMNEVFAKESRCRNNIQDPIDMLLLAKRINEDIHDHGWRHALFCCLLNTIGRKCSNISWMSKYIIDKDATNMADVADAVAYVFNRMEDDIVDLAALQLERMVENGHLSQLVVKARARQASQI